MTAFAVIIVHMTNKGQKNVAASYMYDDTKMTHNLLKTLKFKLYRKIQFTTSCFLIIYQTFRVN